MKKLISLAAILLLCVCLFAVSASAAPASASFTGPDTVRAGDTITLTFSLNGSGIFGASGKLSYDSSQLTLIETQQVIGNNWVVEWHGNNFIAYDDSNNMDQPINGNVTIFTVTFKVKSDLATGAAVTVSAINVKASDGNADTNIGTVSYAKTITPPIFEYSVIDGDACITGYNGDGGLVTIPGVIDGYTVTQIGDYAFEECTNITGIVIPDSVVSIGEMAFYKCSALADITMGRSVAAIGSAAFLNCDNLKNVYIYDASAWCNVEYETAYSMPTHLGAKPKFLDANGNLLDHVVLNDTVTEIPNYAFVGFSQMHSITIPGSVTRIGNNAFTGCSALKDIYITDLSAWLKMSATTVDSHPLAINFNEKRLYLNGALLTDLVIPSDIRRIPANAFCYCTSIETVTFHDKVDNIGENAFAWVVPDLYVTDPSAWCKVDFLSDLTFGSVIVLDAQGNPVTDLVLDSTVTSIPAYAFAGCQSIQSVTIPNSVTSIGDGAFIHCKNLAMLNIGNRVQTISDRAFEGCTNLLTVRLSASLNSVGVDAFSDCDRLNIFYEGTKAQVSNTESGGAWHYEVEDAIFADQECYYCGDCDTYLNAFGKKILATVVFEDYDGTVIDTQQYPYKATITAPADPVRAGNQVATYIFTGWNESVGICTGNATFTATYSTQYVQYLVRFEDEDGTVLSSKIYHWGDEITVPANPTKVSDNTYNYAFNGWDQDVVNCAGSVTYTATYKATYREYVITFLNWNDVVISTETYHWGDEIIVPANPTKASDNTYNYAFNGWDQDVVNCAGNATYTATYTSTFIEYTIVFKNWNGNVISSESYHWGEAISVPADPTRPNDSGYSYTFKGWDKAVVNCAGNATYTATYTAKALVPTTITSSKYTVSSGMISKIELNTTVSALISNLNEGQYAKVYKGTQEVTGSTLVGTGMVVKIMDGTTVKASATIVVTGDTNGDGKTTITDMLAAKAHVLKKTLLEGAAAMAGDTSGDGKITITDFLQLKAHVLGKSLIQPKGAVTVAATSVITASPAASSSGAEQATPVIRVLNYIQTDAIVGKKFTIVL